jgi:CheY-like chemotaxis protein
MARGGSLATSQNESQHILVVNDTEEILDLFRDIIEGLGHRMTAWSFSPDDLAKLTQIEPDLVILDLMLGPTELQGWALLQKMRMSPPTEELPVIVCTAATNWVREQEGWLAANAVKVVLKPFKVQHLEHAIQQALDLPTVTASAELTESESTGRASTPPGPAKDRRSTSEPR